MMTFRGLTWDHPRGYAALERASAQSGGLINWDRQPLEGFESAPIEQVCSDYDLVVLDHPHLGDALSMGCLQPLDGLLTADDLRQIETRTIGACFDSYTYQGHQWALPLDSAAQVSAGRAELMQGDWPQTFAEVDRASEGITGFVMSLAGPHAFLSLLSLCAGLSRDFGPPQKAYFQPHHDQAIDLFLRLASRSAAAGFHLNPIGILDAMAEGELTYCPLIFGYVPYAAQTQNNVITFRDAPKASAQQPPCGVLGGTGIALTAACAPDDGLRAHLKLLLSPELQQGMIPETSGQPSAEAAWTSAAVNALVSDFYLNTLDTLRHAFVRPRYRGYCPAQMKASAFLRASLSSATPERIRENLNAILADGAAD